MKINELFAIVVVLAIAGLFFYGMYKFLVWGWSRKIPKLSDHRLVKAYKETRKTMSIILSVIGGLLLSPFFGIVWYMASKEMHKH